MPERKEVPGNGWDPTHKRIIDPGLIKGASPSAYYWMKTKHVGTDEGKMRDLINTLLHCPLYIFELSFVS